VQARVNDKTDCPPEFGIECTKVLVRIRIDADFPAERFGRWMLI
jgi:hypothetical protein